MLKGPKGEKRLADVVGAAVVVAKIATGKIREATKEKSGRTKSGKAGGRARAKKLSNEKRRQIAKKAAEARWK